MTNVLFITQDSAYPQMGVLYLIDALRKSGIDSEMVASGISASGLEALMNRLQPDVVGMSVMTAPEVADFERHSIFIKENFPGVPVVWGGVHPTLLSDVCAASNYIDHVFIGQGEDVFPQTVMDLVDSRKEVPRKIYGFSPKNIDSFEPAWDKDDISKYLFSERHSVRSPDNKVKEFISRSHDQLVSLFKHDQIGDSDLNRATRLTAGQMEKWDVGLYKTDKMLFYYLLTSRGCPYRCTFCSEPLQVMHGDESNKFKWNAHSKDWVDAQIKTIRDGLQASGLGLDGVGIWDDMFWVKHRTDPRSFSIIDSLRDNGLGYLIEARADQLLRDDGLMMRRLAETGCIQVFIGAESASQETLNYIRKGTKVSDYKRLMGLANEYKVALRMSFIVGFPGETDSNLNETLDFCEAVTNGDYGPWVNISGPKIFTPYPGTLEFDRAVKKGFQSPETNVEWGGINRSTEEYLRHFPWLDENCSGATLQRLEGYFGAGYTKLRAH